MLYINYCIGKNTDKFYSIIKVLNEIEIQSCCYASYEKVHLQVRYEVFKVIKEKFDETDKIYANQTQNNIILENLF